jgi:hypothetical protein
MQDFQSHNGCLTFFKFTKNRNNVLNLRAIKGELDVGGQAEVLALRAINSKAAVPKLHANPQNLRCPERCPVLWRKCHNAGQLQPGVEGKLVKSAFVIESGNLAR